MDSEIEAFVSEFGEHNRKVIESAMKFRRERLSQIPFDQEEFDNHAYIKDVLGRVVDSGVERED